MFIICGTWEKYYETLRQIPDRWKQLVPFVVEALPTFKRYKFNHMLDLGCGAGRHCIYLAKNGFNVIGVDISKSALELAKDWGKNEKLANVSFMRATMTDLPFRKRQFNAVISVSVIHHAMMKNIIKTVDEIYRVLEKNGLFLANLTSVEDYRYGGGQKVEGGTFRILDHFEEESVEELHHFFTKQEVSKLLARFTEAEVKPLVVGKKDQLHHWWKITAVK